MALWSPKGGSGTSVMAAALALSWARMERERTVSLVDLRGDLADVVGLDQHTGAWAMERGVRWWLAAGPATPTEYLDAASADIGGAVRLFRAGHEPDEFGAGGDVSSWSAESGAALVAALRSCEGPAVVDCSTLRGPVVRAIVDTADAAFVVVRPCYLALAAARRSPLVETTSGVVLIDEQHRTIGMRDVSEVLQRPVVVRLPWSAAISRLVDAGVFVHRLPSELVASCGRVLSFLGVEPVRAPR